MVHLLIILEFLDLILEDQDRNWQQGSQVKKLSVAILALCMYQLTQSVTNGEGFAWSPVRVERGVRRGLPTGAVSNLILCCLWAMQQ